MAADPLGFLIEQHRSLGPIFRVRAGHMKVVVMAGERANAFARVPREPSMAAARRIDETGRNCSCRFAARRCEVLRTSRSNAFPRPHINVMPPSTTNIWPVT
jgi:hypothetical protein